MMPPIIILTALPSIILTKPPSINFDDDIEHNFDDTEIILTTMSSMTLSSII